MTMKTSKWENATLVLPILIPFWEKAEGKLRLVLPQIAPAIPSSRINRPKVTITALSCGLFWIGRISTSWTTPPRTKPQARATTKATQ